MFIAMNRITCTPEYAERFEHLFASRAREVDKMEGFHWVKVLRPKQEGKPYIVMSAWDKQEQFDAWRKSDAFTAGHKRGFQDVSDAKKSGERPPMTSDMELYEVFTT